MSLIAQEIFDQVRAYCLAKEGAAEDYPWHDVVWKVDGKLFAGGSQGGSQFTVKATPEEQAVLVEHPAIRVADYVGRFGWVTISVTDDDTLRLALKLIDESYAAVRKGRKRKA